MIQKIEGKFYPLQHKEWVRACHELTPALGQILVYSGFYPEHSKWIHLFGSQQQLQEVADIEAACFPFDVNVTAQEVRA